MLLSNLSLILEGGGMRGMFSAGVFDAFLEKELVFPHIALQRKKLAAHTLAVRFRFYFKRYSPPFNSI